MIIQAFFRMVRVDEDDTEVLLDVRVSANNTRALPTVNIYNQGFSECGASDKGTIEISTMC